MRTIKQEKMSKAKNKCNKKYTQGKYHTLNNLKKLHNGSITNSTQADTKPVVLTHK